jgi:hypothetical protein
MAFTAPIFMKFTNTAASMESMGKGKGKCPEVKYD